MPESIHDYVLRRLEAAKGTWPAIANTTGVPLRTLEKIARQEIEDPGISHIQKLWDHFIAAEASQQLRQQ